MKSNSDSSHLLATDQNIVSEALSDVSESLLAIRDQVFDVWEAQVRAQVTGACEVLTPVLVDTLPAFYGNLAQAVSENYPRDLATSHNNAAAAHGSERARMTNFGPDQVVHEYQLFREALEVVTAEHGITLKRSHWAIIDRSINAAMRSAVREFTVVTEELRGKIAAALSHDMRTPLAVISNGAQLIDIAPDLPYAQRVAKKINANALRMAEMIAEVLDALTTHRGENLPLTLTCFNMADLVNGVRRDFEDRLIPSIEVIADSVVGYWCYNTMRRAVENLVTNAGNYGAGDEIRIHATDTRGRLIISVHNSGNPIKPDQLDGIFQLVQRPKHALIRGWGIGLAFVKRAAEDHGGSVAVDSSDAAGTTFLIDVPVDCRPFVKSEPAGS